MAAVKSVDLAEIRLDGLAGRTVAVLGYGSQGASHALNLRDSGLRVVVGQRPGRRFEEAVAAGFSPVSIAEAVNAADLVIFGLPDDAAPGIFKAEIGAHLRAGQALGFIHGFVVHYRLIDVPVGVDVVMVAPKAQGRGVRSEFVAGRGVLALVAVAVDATGRARETALAWAAGLGCGRAGVLETTFADETETDLFGEQAVLCGGLTALIKAAFETLVEAGYPAELAYFECCHEIKLLADLIHEGGITHMRERISSTARFGDVTRGPRVVDPRVKAAMRAMLEEIRSGGFAKEFIEDAGAGALRSKGLVEQDRGHLIERVGGKIRAMMRGAIGER
ncbi:MAG: ketol-acid reductoisomerase [Phycisphaerales bacterium]|nr:ketol-acid reductoisomerase [Phycisphaerales bacterium]